MLTTVQDLGRWGYQSDGVPVAGAMDLAALRFGNAMLGNDENSAAIEVTILGPEIAIEGAGLAVFAGADLGFCVNKQPVGAWKVVALKTGDVISFSGPKGSGCRGYICFAGGIDVPVVMGSRSTYTRAKIGGLEGRALKTGDVLKTFAAKDAVEKYAGFELPGELRPVYSQDIPLKVLTGLQEDAFTDAGKETLFSSEYTVSAESDRMGSRIEGPKVEHGEKGADIVSDGIPMGTVQIPGHGTPIVMLADRQTTGGYTKIGVLTPASIQQIVQRMPGSKVRFERAVMEDAVNDLRKTQETVQKISELREARALAKPAAPAQAETPLAGAKRTKQFKMTVNGKSYDIVCEEY